MSTKLVLHHLLARWQLPSNIDSNCSIYRQWKSKLSSLLLKIGNFRRGQRYLLELSRIATIRGTGTPSETVNLLFFCASAKGLAHATPFAELFGFRLCLFVWRPRNCRFRAVISHGLIVSFDPLLTPRSVVRRRRTCRSTGSQVAVIAGAGQSSDLSLKQRIHSEHSLCFCP